MSSSVPRAGDTVTLIRAARSAALTRAASTSRTVNDTRPPRVAAETAHVERHLADRLRRVEQEEHARLARDLADGLGGLDESAVGRHVRHGDHAYVLVDALAQSADVELTGGVGRNDLDAHTTTRAVQVRDEHRVVLRHR